MVEGCKALLVDTNSPSSSLEQYRMGDSSAEPSGTSLYLLLMALVLTTLCWGVAGTVLVKDGCVATLLPKAGEHLWWCRCCRNLAGWDRLCARHATCSGCRTEDWCVLDGGAAK